MRTNLICDIKTSRHKFQLLIKQILILADEYIYFIYIPKLFSIMLFLSFVFQDYIIIYI